MILFESNRVAMWAFFAIAMVGAVMLIANLIFGGLWYVFPLARIVEQSD